MKDFCQLCFKLVLAWCAWGVFVVVGFVGRCFVFAVFEEKAVFHAKRMLLWSSLHLVFRVGRLFL